MVDLAYIILIIKVFEICYIILYLILINKNTIILKKNTHIDNIFFSSLI